jgi:hypothetical protein
MRSNRTARSKRRARLRRLALEIDYSKGRVIWLKEGSEGTLTTENLPKYIFGLIETFRRNADSI